jgi:hypothetical protein
VGIRQVKSFYTIETHEYGMVVRGEIPVDDFLELGQMWSKRGFDATVPGVAEALGATFAVCATANVEAWMRDLQTEANQKAGDDAELAWLTGPDTGISSKTIFSVLSERYGSQARFSCPSVPRDPSDFGRCHRLLEAMPEWRSRLPEVAAVHPEWGPLVREWDKLTEMYLEELPSGRCPKLYRKMQALIGRATA